MFKVNDLVKTSFGDVGYIDNIGTYDAYEVYFINVPYKNYRLTRIGSSLKKISPSTYFKELFNREINRFKVKSLDHALEFEEKHLKVGCQEISREDSIKIAKHILKTYGE